MEFKNFYRVTDSIGAEANFEEKKDALDYFYSFCDSQRGKIEEIRPFGGNEFYREIKNNISC